MFSIILSNIHYVIIGIVTFFTIYILRRNTKLTIEKNELVQNNIDKEKVINIQRKVLNASDKVKPAIDINDAIDRLSEKDKN